MVTLHDLCHCTINDPKLARNDQSTLMTISGHKTTSVFQRYYVVTDDELIQTDIHVLQHLIRVGSLAVQAECHNAASLKVVDHRVELTKQSPVGVPFVNDSDVHRWSQQFPLTATVNRIGVDDVPASIDLEITQLFGQVDHLTSRSRSALVRIPCEERQSH